MFTLRFDTRAPDFGAPATALYSAAAEMSAWAETRGCIADVVLPEAAKANGATGDGGLGGALTELMATKGTQ